MKQRNSGEVRMGVDMRVAVIGEEYAANARSGDLKYFGAWDGHGPRRLAEIGPILGIAG